MQSDDVDDEKIAAILAELRQLRLRLNADLAVAANAVTTGDNDIAADIVDADSIELQHFLALADAQLKAGQIEGVSSMGPARARRLRRRALAMVPAVAVLAAAGTAAAIVGSSTPHSTSSLHASTQQLQTTGRRVDPNTLTADTTVSDRFHQLRAAIVGEKPSKQVLEAAQRLHKQLSILIKQSDGNPAKVAQIERWLQAEKSLVKGATPMIAEQILADSRQLAQHLLTPISHLPLPLPSKSPILDLTPSAKPTHSAVATSTPTPKKSPTTSPSPRTSRTSRPTPSWSPTNPIAGLGDFHH